MNDMPDEDEFTADGDWSWWLNVLVLAMSAVDWAWRNRWELLTDGVLTLIVLALHLSLWKSLLVGCLMGFILSMLRRTLREKS
jgi:hypothetical protein